MPELLEFLLKGMLVGFSIALPVGPVGFLCLQQSVSGGMALGVSAGLGAAIADTLYGAVAAFGVTFVSEFMLGHQMWLRGGGGLFLAWMGVKMYRDRRVPARQKVPYHKLVTAFFSTGLLTLTNPLTVVGFAAIFAGLGLGEAGVRGYAHAVALTVGVFAGSAFWWMLLAVGASLFRDKVFERFVAFRKIFGLVILGFGVFAVASVGLKLL